MLNLKYDHRLNMTRVKQMPFPKPCDSFDLVGKQTKTSQHPLCERRHTWLGEIIKQDLEHYQEIIERFHTEIFQMA